MGFFPIPQIGASYQMSNVSIYVVDLKRVNPTAASMSALAAATAAAANGTGGAPAAAAAGAKGPNFKAGQHVRRSFVKEKPGPNGAKPRYVLV